jgi:putative sigma-54 modulation protein
MQFSVTFRQMEATEALKNYAKERMERIRKYFPDPIAVHVVMSTERGYNHRVDVTMQLHNGLTVAGHEATENMYSSLDLVAAKIERQVRRYKDKLRTHKTRAMPPVSWSHSVVSELPGEALPGEVGEVGEMIEDETATGAEVSAPAPTPMVVKTETLQADPMTVEEAIMQLNLLHRQFLVFCHSESGAINVVYRREDDSYGLIETAPWSPAETASSA